MGEIKQVALDTLTHDPANVRKHSPKNIEAIKASLQRFGHMNLKPVDWVIWLCERISNKNDSVFDPFLGSGTTLIGCEQLDRTCYGMEIEPKYVDVIIKRWENFTGQKAVKQNE